MSPTQVIRHRKAVLMAVFSQLSNVGGGGGVNMLDQRLTDWKTAECVLGVPFLWIHVMLVRCKKAVLMAVFTTFKAGWGGGLCWGWGGGLGSISVNTTCNAYFLGVPSEHFYFGSSHACLLSLIYSCYWTNSCFSKLYLYVNYADKNAVRGTGLHNMFCPTDRKAQNKSSELCDLVQNVVLTIFYIKFRNCFL